MTTTSGLAVQGAGGSLDAVLAARGFKKTTNGQWERSDGTVRVYAFGDQPSKGWKIFQLEGSSFKAIPGATGSGPDELVMYLRDLAL